MNVKDFSYKSCYVHSSRPAMRNCAQCGKPICKECSSRLEDSFYCKACFAEIQKLTEKEEEARKEETLLIPPAPEPRLPVQDVTVHANGMVEIREEKRPEHPLASKEISVTDTSEKKENQESKGKESGEEALPVEIIREAEEFEAAVEEAIKKEVKPEEKIASEKKERVSGRKTRSAKKKKDTSVEAIPEKKQKKATISKLIKSIANNQTFTASILGFMAGVVVFAFWLLFPLLDKRWSHVSIITAGIVIPWIIHSLSTKKDESGNKVEKPSPIKCALISLPITAILSGFAEYIAFRIAIRNTIYGWVDYKADFLKGPDWILIACGLLLSISVPFLLSNLRTGSVNQKKSVNQ
ncbi:MAG: hypothetical protein PHP64_01745 [Actinomycetota bacterium]|nr:hypothetical protein [Actinomycetota bacterium]